MAEITSVEGSYLTHKGRSLVAKALAMKTGIHFTRATIGKGTLDAGKDYRQLEDLVEYVCDGMIASVENPELGEVAIAVQAHSIGVKEGFFVTEVGLWAEDPDEGDVLYGYISLQDHPEWMRPDHSVVNKLATFNLITIVEGVKIVSASINPNAFVRFSDLDKLSQAKHRHEIEDINGLQDWLDKLQLQIELVKEQLTNDMTGGIDVAFDFRDLTNVKLIEGILDRDTKSIYA